MKFRLFSLPAAIDTWRRFPLPLLCGAGVFLLALVENHGLAPNLIADDDLGRLAGILFVGIFFHWAIAILPAARGSRTTIRQVLALAVHLSFGAAVFGLPIDGAIWPIASGCAVGLLLAAVTPYLSSRDDLSFWQFNRIVWQGIGIAIAAGVLLAGGVSVGLLGIEELFGVDFRSRIYGDIWTFAFLIVVPTHALSFTPAMTVFPEADCRAPRPLSVIIDWIMAPLALGYMLILYAYFLKIGIAWELPKGVLAYLVTAFGGFGVVTYLAGWPMRQGGGPLLRVFYKVFIPAMALPVALQAVAIYQRVAEYGLTENRVAIIVATVWFALVIALRLFRPLPLKLIPGILALLLAVVAAGPLSAYRLSVWDQSNRLDAILQRHGMLQGDRIVPAAGDLPPEDRVSISSIASFLVSRGADDGLRRRLNLEDPDPSAYDITQAMGFDYMSEWEYRNPSTYRSLQLGAMPDTVPIDGFDLLLQERTARPGIDRNWIDEGGWESAPTVNAGYADGVLTYTLTGKGSVSLDVLPLLKAEAEKTEEERTRFLVAEGGNENFRVRVYFWANAWKDTPPAEETGDAFHIDALHFLTLFSERKG